MNILLAVLVLAAMPVREGVHSIEINHAVGMPEDGLLLGNGDLSCSVCQEADEIVFRFGKGDVWDRRMDYSTREKNPVTHDEFVRGMLDEGWVHAKAGAKATKGTKDEKRMQEVMRGGNQVARDWPYPCPKPTGELRMRIPADLPQPYQLKQRLAIEDGILDISVRWRNGVEFTAEAVIDPTENVFSLAWRVDGLKDEERPYYHAGPVSFTLMRRQDEDVLAFGAKFMARSSHDWFSKFYQHGKATPLPMPRTMTLSDGRHAVEQEFPAERTFPQGFRCRLTLTPNRKGEWTFEKGGAGSRERLPDACVCYWPKVKEMSGSVRVTVTTSSDASLEAAQPKPHAEIAAAAKAAARKAWARSSLSLPGDRFLENLWYAVYHARRCVLRPGTVPPGLFMPSTVADYSNWNGDYHSNYNYQSIYWGGFTANRLDEEMTGIECTELFREVGRMRARRYYGMRGSFVPLECYPIRIEDDYSTQIPRGRMVYMTGWASVPYWTYYLHTLDRGFLERFGYPALKDYALFYLDFLKKAPSKDLPPELKDGKYHAFPSIEEETQIRSLADVTDRPQVIAFVRYALYAAIEASKVLDVDADLRRQWQDRLDNLATEPTDLKGYARHCHLVNSPEFGYRTPVPKDFGDWKGEKSKFDSRGNIGHSIRWRIAKIRTSKFIPGRDFDAYRRALSFWARPNGMLMGMSVDVWGRSGGWTETLSCLAPLQEMMLQSWDGAIRLFPYWPKDRDAAFKTFRAQGAFLVSSEWKGGRIGKTMVFSEKGADCHVHGTWRVRDSAGVEVATTQDEFGRQCFKTCSGKTYELTRP